MGDACYIFFFESASASSESEVMLYTESSNFIEILRWTPPHVGEGPGV